MEEKLEGKQRRKEIWTIGRTFFSAPFSSCSSFLRYSIAVNSTTWVKGTNWQRINHMSINLMSEVGGRPSILLMMMVVNNNMVVRFTLSAASKKKSLKKVVLKVIIKRKIEGK